MTRGRPSLAIAMLTCVLAACSGQYDRFAVSPPTTLPPTTTTPRTTVAPPTTTTPRTTTTVPGASTTTLPPTPAGPPDGRLAVIADDGALVVMRPDGSGVTTIADPPATGTNLAPTWSGDGARIAFSAAGPTGAIRVADAAPAAGPTTTTTPAPQQRVTPPPVYYAWDRALTRLAMLRAPVTGTVELAVIDSSLANPPKSLQLGAATYGAWSPDGTRLLAHVDDQIILIDPIAGSTALGVRAAPSGALAWLDDSTALVAIQTLQGQVLARLDVSTGTHQDLLSYDGSITYVLDPAGKKAALQVLPGASSGGGGSRVSFPRAQTPPPPTTTTPAVPAVPAATQNQLLVLDLTSDALTKVADQPARAFQWSPDGSRLAFLASAPSNTFLWRFWSPGTAPIDGTLYVPSRSVQQDELPLFDQLDQSTSWWSPNGQAFAFAGIVNGRDGIWVLPVGAAAAPVRVSDGQVVAWSPH